MSDYLKELMAIAEGKDIEKIADESVPEDLETDPMNPDEDPDYEQEVVDSMHTKNVQESEESPEAESLNPPSPEESEELKDVVDGAGEELEDTLEENEKKASDDDEIEEYFYGMSTLATLVKLATDGETEDVQDDAMSKLEQLTESEEMYEHTLMKAAEELFSDETFEEFARSEAGQEKIAETLEFFASDDLEKVASPQFMNKMKMGQIGPKVRQGAKGYADALRGYGTRKQNMNTTQQQARAMSDELNRFAQMESAGIANNRPDLINAAQRGVKDLGPELQRVNQNYSDAIGAFRQSQQAYAGTAGGVAGAGLLGGMGAAHAKKKSNQQEEGQEESLSEKKASDTINQDSNASQTKGGFYKMSKTKDRQLVESFLKVAGAAGLMEIAYNEGYDDELRKEASDTFDEIARYSQSDMHEAFVKVAQNIYNEDELREIVAGYHTDNLFEKVAFFTSAYEAPFDELEKVAGAESVAAKGVGGALTDAKKQIEETVDKDKSKTETSNAKQGSKPAGSMEGYNVINDPGEYDVDKTAQEFEQDFQLVKQASAEYHNLLNEFSSKYNV